MPIDFLSSTRSAAKWAFGSPFLNKVLGSSMFVAGIVSFLMIMLIMIMYPAKSGTSFSIVLKMFVYMFFGSLLVIFLHDGVVRYMADDARNQAESEAFMQNITQTGRIADPSYASLYKPIVPNQPTQQSSSTTGAAETVGADETVEVITLPTTFVVSETPTLGGAPAKWKPRPEAKNPYR